MSNKVRRIIIATENLGKIKEIRYILRDYPIDIYSKKEMNLHMDIQEDGETFEDNAIKKAKTIMELTGEPAIADDSGLEVEALGGKPGVYSARFAGEDATDEDNIDRLLKVLKGVPYNNRKARFICVIAMALINGKIVTFKGECNGYITQEPIGVEGFGYDPVFLVPEHGKTFAELGKDIKNTISHRAEAMEKLKTYINENLTRGLFDEDNSDKRYTL